MCLPLTKLFDFYVALFHFFRHFSFFVKSNHSLKGSIKLNEILYTEPQKINVNANASTKQFVKGEKKCSNVKGVYIYRYKYSFKYIQCVCYYNVLLQKINEELPWSWLRMQVLIAVCWHSLQLSLIRAPHFEQFIFKFEVLHSRVVESLLTKCKTMCRKWYLSRKLM